MQTKIFFLTWYQKEYYGSDHCHVWQGMVDALSGFLVRFSLILHPMRRFKWGSCFFFGFLLVHHDGQEKFKICSYFQPLSSLSRQIVRRIHRNPKTICRVFFLSGIRQRLCQVLDWLSAKKVTETARRWWRLLCRVSRRKNTMQSLKHCQVLRPKHSAKFKTLPSAKAKTLGKKVRRWQIVWSLCQVSTAKHSVFMVALPSVKVKHSAKLCPEWQIWPLYQVLCP